MTQRTNWKYASCIEAPGRSLPVRVQLDKSRPHYRGLVLSHFVQLPELHYVLDSGRSRDAQKILVLRKNNSCNQ